MNNIIGTLPKVIPKAHIIRSAGCPSAPDHLHFIAEGYKTLSKRYAITMLEILGHRISEKDKAEVSM